MGESDWVVEVVSVLNEGFANEVVKTKVVRVLMTLEVS